MTLSIHIFGKPRLLIDTTIVRFVAPPKAFPLLAYLLLHRSQPIDRQQIAFALWPDNPEADGRSNLRRHLHHVQRALPPAPPGQPWLLLHGTTVQWNPHADFWLDVAEFERLAAQPATLAEAVRLYQGELLETVYDDWVFFERERLHQAYLNALYQLAVQRRSRCQYGDAAAYAQQLLSHEPFREDALRQLIAARYQAGDRAGAIAEYEQFVKRLRQEMDAAPMPETVALYKTVFNNDRLMGEKPLAPPVEDMPPLKPPIAQSFVGRQAEMARLTAWWSQAARGRGGLVLISGEAGIGKSRLAREMGLLAESQGARLLYGACPPGEERPYQAVSEALQSAIPMLVNPAQDTLRLAALAVLLPALHQHLSLPNLPPLVPEREQLRLFDAVATSLEKLAAPHPLFIIFEDLHWAGLSTLALIEFLARRAAHTPLLLVVTYRDEEVQRTHPLRALLRRLQSEKLVHPLALRRLDAHAVRALAEDAQLPDAAEMAQRLHATSEGNPLFLRLLVQYCQENGSLADGELPRDVWAAVSQRLARLSSLGRAYAQVAAVLGLTFDAEAAREIGGWDECQALDALSELLDQRLSHDVEQGNDYIFAHHLVQATLYQEIPAAKRRQRHRRAAEVLEDLYPERCGDLAGALAKHFDLGGEAQRAIPYYLREAQQRLALFADPEALAALDRALALVDQKASTTSADAIELLLLREAIYSRRGERQQQQEDLQRLEQLSIALGEPELACEVLTRRISYFKGIDDRTAHKQAIDELKRQAQALGSPPWQAEATFAEGNYYKLTNEFSEAVVYLQDALERYRALQNIQRQTVCCCHLAEVFVILRQVEEAERWGQQALALCSDQVPASHLLNALWGLAANGLMVNDLERCLKYAGELLSAAERASDRTWQAAAHRLLGMAYQHRFQIAETDRHLNEALHLYRLIQKPKGCSLALQSLGHLALSLGHYPSAMRHYQQSFKITEQLNDVGGMATECINLSCTASFDGDYLTEQKYAQQGVNLARQVQNRFLEAMALQNLGEAERELGDLDAARQHLNAALEILQTLSLAKECISVLSDLALAHWKAGDLPQALQRADEIMTGYPEVEGRDDNVHRFLWSAARIWHAAGQTEQAEQALAQAYRTYQEASAAIPDAESRLAFSHMLHNCQIAAAYERGEWI